MPDAAASIIDLADPDLTPSARLAISRTRKMRWWYESLADYMIANPTAHQNDIATYFGRNPATISTVINTDAFKAYFRQRRAQHAEKLDTAVRDKLFKVADTSLDHLLTALDKKRDSVPLELLHRTTDMALKNLGYGAGPPTSVVNVSAPPTTVNVAVSLDDLERARAALRQSQSQVVDIEPAALGGGAPGQDAPESACEAGSAGARASPGGNEDHDPSDI